MTTRQKHYAVWAEELIASHAFVLQRRSIKKAIVDFEHSLIGRYEYLSSNAPILSQALQEQLSYLRTLIRQN